MLLTVASPHPEPTRTGGFVFAQPGDLVTPTSGHVSNVFYQGQPVTFTFGGDSQSYEVRDYWGNLVDSGPALPTTTLNVSRPGWYKLYLYGSQTSATFGDVDGGTTFVIFRNNPNFPTLPAVNPNLDPTGAGDPAVRDAIAMGPERYEADASNPAASIARLDAQIAYDTQNYSSLDPQRHRALMISFPAGTSNLAGVIQIVQHFQNQVQYWSGQNEPDQVISGNNYYANGADYVPVEQAFYNAVKSVNPNLKVLGPGVVTIGPYHGLPWLNQFLGAGGGKYIDALSFQAYNSTNGDLALGRQSFQGLANLLNQYGLGNIEKWQIEEGFMTPVYGAYEPTNQGRWEMLQQMVFEQYGIPKEHDVYWYDKDHGFPDFPFWWENQDGSLNPAAALMRVWSEELYGTNFAQAYDFGPTANNTYIGSLFSGPGKSVAVFMSGGATDGQITLNVSGTSLHVVDAFGNGSDLPVVNGQLVLNVPNLPVYVELAGGQTLSVAPQNWGPDLALLPGVVAKSDGDGLGYPMYPNVPDSVDKVHNGILENWYYTQTDSAHPWMDNTPAGSQPWVELDFPAPQVIDHVIVRAPSPWQGDGAPLDYLLQYDNNGQWVTLDHVQEDPKTFGVFSPQTHTTVDSFYSQRSVFLHSFAPVSTSRIRLLVNNETWGGGATQEVVQAGGQTGQHQLNLQEIEVYGPPPSQPLASSATYVRTDTATQGSWNGVYGSQGYDVFGGTSALPAYAQLSFSGYQSITWSPTTADARAMQTAAGSSTRVAASYYSDTSFTLDLNLTDGRTHQVALYMLDWDSFTRSQTVVVTDAATGAMLDARVVTGFFNGQWLVWNLSGHVKITLTNTGFPNSMAQGIVFDPAIQ